jgi:KipI family sensor histidine kinase inhibitor
MPESRRTRVRACGDDLLCIATRDVRDAQRLARELRGDTFWLEVVPGQDSVVVQFDSARNTPEDARARLERLPPGNADEGAAASGSVIEIPVCYGGDDGPDLRRVCSELGIAPETLVALHTGTEHRVELLGFTPGFAYISGLDPRLEVGRLAAPRQRLPAGAVGIAGVYTGLYALPGPGGWALIGRTPLRLFDASRPDPFCLRPGQRVRFTADEGCVP